MLSESVSTSFEEISSVQKSFLTRELIFNSLESCLIEDDCFSNELTSKLMDRLHEFFEHKFGLEGYFFGEDQDESDNMLGIYDENVGTVSNEVKEQEKQEVKGLVSRKLLRNVKYILKLRKLKPDFATPKTLNIDQELYKIRDSAITAATDVSKLPQLFDQALSTGNPSLVVSSIKNTLISKCNEIDDQLRNLKLSLESELFSEQSTKAMDELETYLLKQIGELNTKISDSNKKFGIFSGDDNREYLSVMKEIKTIETRIQTKEWALRELEN